VLIVGDDESIAAEHDAVAPAKGFGDHIGYVYLNLESDIRLVVEPHRSFSKVLGIGFSSLQHLIVPLRVGLVLFQDLVVLGLLDFLEVQLGADFTDAVRNRSLSRILAGLFR